MSKKKKKTVSNAPVVSEEAQFVHFLSYEITWEPIYEKHYQLLPRQVKDRILELHDISQARPLEAIDELKRLIEQYPDVPVFRNYLTAAYTIAGDQQKADEVTIENYRLNPDYLFARVNYAEICLRRGDYQKVAETFDNKFDLKLLYPCRAQFHVSEFVAFSDVIGRYFLAIGDLNVANAIYEGLCQVAPDHPVTQRLHVLLWPQLLQRLLGKRRRRR